MKFEDNPNATIVKQLADEEVAAGRPVTPETAEILHQFLTESEQSQRDADATNLGHLATGSVMTQHSGYENGRRA